MWNNNVTVYFLAPDDQFPRVVKKRLIAGSCCHQAYSLGYYVGIFQAPRMRRKHLLMVLMALTSWYAHRSQGTKWLASDAPSTVALDADLPIMVTDTSALTGASEQTLSLAAACGATWREAAATNPD